MPSMFAPGAFVQVKGRPDLVVYVSRVSNNKFVQGFYGWPVKPVDMRHEAVAAPPYLDKDFELVDKGGDDAKTKSRCK